ncbi:histidine triad nucleotide-binding protein [Undibacterium sp. RuRC25W]|uniref:histidine triad nucleotide-binding protein n=1 Tax=Undibacterium sp. RuRC25W TaxID=3413047 RepID=UPI003BF4577A
MDNCIFCKIASKQIPSTIVYEDDELLAFKDINPAAPVHLLVIPKIHLDTLSSALPEHHVMLGKMLGLAPQLAVEHGCGPVRQADGQYTGGYKTLINTGADGGQEVYHLHMHVIGGPKLWRGQS